MHDCKDTLGHQVHRSPGPCQATVHVQWGKTCTAQQCTSLGNNCCGQPVRASSTSLSMQDHTAYQKPFRHSTVMCSCQFHCCLPLHLLLYACNLLCVFLGCVDHGVELYEVDPRNMFRCMPHREGGLDQRGSQTQLMRGMGLSGALALRALLSETSSRRQPQKVCNGCKLCMSSCHVFHKRAHLCP